MTKFWLMLIFPGTLTQNQMTVTKAWIAGKLYENLTEFRVKEGDEEAEKSLSKELSPKVDELLSNAVALNCSAALRIQDTSGIVLCIRVSKCYETRKYLNLMSCTQNGFVICSTLVFNMFLTQTLCAFSDCSWQRKSPWKRSPVQSLFCACITNTV